MVFFIYFDDRLIINTWYSNQLAEISKFDALVYLKKEGTPANLPTSC